MHLFICAHGRQNVESAAEPEMSTPSQSDQSHQSLETVRRFVLFPVQCRHNAGLDQRLELWDQTETSSVLHKHGDYLICEPPELIKHTELLREAGTLVDYT